MTLSVVLLRAVLVVWGATIGALALLGFAVLFTPAALTTLGALVVAVSAVLTLRFLRGGGFAALADFSPLETGLLLAILATLGERLVAGLHKEAFIYDTLSFHLHFPAAWLHSSRLEIVPTVFGDVAPAYNPSNSELIFALLMAPIGSDALAQCGQVPFAALASLAIHATARSLGAPRWTSLGATLGFLLIPAIWQQTSTAMVDLALAATFLATLPWLVRLWQAPARGDVMALALAVGLFVGTKFTALADFVPLAVAAAVIAWKHRGALRTRRAGDAFAIAAIVTAVGGFWYLRNVIVTGNPLYPVALRLGGVTVFPGVYDLALMRVWDYHVPVSRLDVLTRMLSTMGVGFALSAAAAVGLALRFGRWRLPALSLALLAVFWLVIPYQHARFLYPLFGVLAILIAVEAGLHAHGSFGILVATAGSVLAAPTLGRFSILAAMAGGTLLGRARPRFRAVVVAVATVAFAAVVGRELVQYDDRFPGYTVGDEIDEGWAWVWQHIHNETVAYAGMNVPFPLAGRKLGNRVVYANVAIGPDARLHDFDRIPHPPATSAEPPLYREGASFETWWASLRSLKATTVVVAALYPIVARNIAHDADGFPVERAWADAHPERFLLRFANRRVRVYAALLRVR